METQGMGGCFSNALTSLQVTPRTSENVDSGLKAEGAVDKASPSLNSRPESMMPTASEEALTSMISILPPPPTRKIALPPPTPKDVDVGIILAESCPHAVIELAKGGAAAECGLISVDDKLVEVDMHDVTNVSLETCSKYILGPEGSKIHLKLLRPTPSPPERPAKTIETPKMVGVGLMLDIKKKENGTLVHNISGVAKGGAAAESASIAVNDQLVAVNGKECSKLDGKQLNALIVGPEGSSITMEILRFSKNERFEVVLIRGGSAYKKKCEDNEMAYQKVIEQYDKQYSHEPDVYYEVELFRGGSEGKLRVQAELEAHRKLVERVEEENTQSEAAYKEMLQRHNRWQALCDLKDSKIAQEAATSALLRKDIARLQEELEKVVHLPFSLHTRDNERWRD
jgi:hypothetical protein